MKTTKPEYDLVQRRAQNKPRNTNATKPSTPRMVEFNSLKLIQATFASLVKLGGMVRDQIPEAQTALPYQYKATQSFTKFFAKHMNECQLSPISPLRGLDTTVPPDEEARREAEFQRLHGGKEVGMGTPYYDQASSTPTTIPHPKPPQNLKPGDFDVDEVVSEMVDLLANNQIPKQTPEQRQAFLEEQKRVQELTEELRRNNEAMQSRSVIIGPGNALYDALSAKETPEEAADWERRHNEALARWERGERDE